MSYQEFINSIKESRENKWFEHSECHHILPRCLGGSDDPENLIYLSYEEHFVAHKLLHEENPDNRDLLLPLLFYNTYTPEEYAELRRAFIDSQRGENNPMYRKKWEMSEEGRRKISEAMKRYQKTPEHCLHISESKKGKYTGDENHMRQLEHRERQSRIYESLPDDHPMKNHSGEDSPLYGTHFTWMTNGINNRRAKNEAMKSELESQGFYVGYTHTPNNSDEASKSRREGRANVIYIRTCKICGREFESRSGNAKYCGCQ